MCCGKANETQRKNPFILGYTSILNAELGNFDKALQLSDQLSSILPEDNQTKACAILVDVYFKMKDYESALIYARKSNQLDSINLDESRILIKIEKAIGK